MSDQFDKFTDRARQALGFADEEARALHHDYVGQEHLLLGLARVEEGLAAKALANLGCGPEQVRESVLAVVGRGAAAPEGAIVLTPRAKRAIELGVEEARDFKHHYVGTEHLLLGLLAEGEGVGAQVLAGLGITADAARAEVLRLLALPQPGVAKQGITRFVSQLVERDRGLKRYNLVLPEELFRQVQELADREHTTVVEVLRRFIKLGLLATRVAETPDSAIILREGGREREVLLL
jgi:ATP-dependent Clp protease ATP-binding subunit ClpA